MLIPGYKTKFKKDLQLAAKRGKNLKKVKKVNFDVIQILSRLIQKREIMVKLHFIYISLNFEYYIGHHS